MKTSRWLLAVITGVAVGLAPGAAQSIAAPAAAQAPGPAGYADPDTWLDEGPGPVLDDRGGWLPGEWGTEPDPDGGVGGVASMFAAEPLAAGLCQPGTPPNAPQTTAFFGSNPLLGPAVLPTASPVGPLLSGYQRFGGLTEAQFLQQYANANASAYVYPPDDGFALAPDGRPIRTAQTLLPGYRLDRFGFPGGQFLAPLGTPFSSRSLPPPNLNTPANAPLANYHVYCVVKPFQVDSGPIAPWFAQPGYGTQFKLNPAYLPEAGTALNVTWLLTHGFLVEENLDSGTLACDDSSRERATAGTC